jgi:hypothetical protein
VSESQTRSRNRIAVDLDRRIAGRRGECFALHPQHAKARALIEAQHGGIRCRCRDEQGGATLLAANCGGPLDEEAANPAPLTILPDSEALDLRLVVALAGGELQMTDDGRPVSRNEHTSQVAVAANGSRGVVCQREEVRERLAGAFEPIDHQHVWTVSSTLVPPRNARSRAACAARGERTSPR